ncbi:MAG: RsiV family protein [Gallintestinimicrobium sp.]
MKEQMAADENKIYWLDSDMPEWDFTSITDNTSFYLNQNNEVVVCFNEGDVAPMSMVARNLLFLTRCSPEFGSKVNEVCRAACHGAARSVCVSATSYVLSCPTHRAALRHGSRPAQACRLWR